jgi:hypothetical protein
MRLDRRGGESAVEAGRGEIKRQREHLLTGETARIESLANRMPLIEWAVISP